MQSIFHFYQPTLKSSINTITHQSNKTSYQQLINKFNVKEFNCKNTKSINVTHDRKYHNALNVICDMSSQYICKTMEIIQTNFPFHELLFNIDSNYYSCQIILPRHGDITQKIQCITNYNKQTINYLCKEIQIKVGNHILYSVQNYCDPMTIDIDCIIPFISSQKETFSLKFLFDQDIIHYPDSILKIASHCSYFDTGPRQHLAVSPFYMENNSGYFENGDFFHKNTHNIVDQIKIPNLFTNENRIFSKFNLDHSHPNQYLLMLSKKEKKLKLHFYHKTKITNQEKYSLQNSTVDLTFQLFDADQFDHSFDSIFTTFFFNQINLLSHTKKITVKCSLSKPPILQYHTKSITNSFHIIISAPDNFVLFINSHI